MDHADPNVAVDAEDYPTVNLAGIDYKVRFNSGTLIRLWENYQLDIEDLAAVQLQGAAALARISKMLSAAIGDQVSLTYMQIADMIPVAKMQKYADAVSEAIKKAGGPEKAAETPDKPTIN